ncbi:hypothetical protein NDU88_002470 [Pleurodeles waltl]|uniref:Secreted protein n=1 Tax=Pleurodeles waltl TaxID=8319 RepID=A0AAV7Q8W6_PLEWA|nr:hypothetical protein NDU88_002470 [Pleurodeles waltl]
MSSTKARRGAYFFSLSASLAVCCSALRSPACPASLPGSLPTLVSGPGRTHSPIWFGTSVVGRTRCSGPLPLLRGIITLSSTGGEEWGPPRLPARCDVHLPQRYSEPCPSRYFTRPSFIIGLGSWLPPRPHMAQDLRCWAHQMQGPASFYCWIAVLLSTSGEVWGQPSIPVNCDDHWLQH